MKTSCQQARYCHSRPGPIKPGTGYSKNPMCAEGVADVPLIQENVAWCGQSNCQMDERRLVNECAWCDTVHRLR